ncbi:hypothetical protein Bca4012_007001 [Brassica carinata]|uniref:BnaCnng71930D protein n=4 Tax=Brassica TaxID=3705 RepID=A0A078JXR4_BRANA|nr:hypothetical protein Bca52824_037739 [Brassica carinata]CDY71225.1 BnaCnng71930D [Brassica napus]VDC98366.1 unnamed protein product [Brassica oleracea]
MSERQDTGDVSLSVKHEEEDVSPESLAWADSCIISFPGDSDNNDWGTFRDALTEIIDIHPQIFVPSSTETTTGVRSRDEVMTEAESVQIPQAADSSSSEQVSEIVSFLTFESDPSKNSLPDHYFPAENRTTNGPVDNHTRCIESIEEDGSMSNGEANEEPVSETPQVVKDDFMSSNYVEDDNADEVDALEDPGNLTPQEIFKVWDLKIVGEDDDEEDGLGLQVKKALDEFSTVQPPNDDDHVVVEKSYIDDLIAGITDLSLTETFE